MTAVDPTTAMHTARDPSPVDSFVDRLSHPVRVESSGAWITLIQTLLSLGMLPLVLWPVRWADYLDGERHDLLDLASWWRRRVDGKRAADLDKITAQLRPRPMLMVLPWLAVAFNVFAMGALLMQGDSPSRIFDLTVHHAGSSKQQTLVQSLVPLPFDASGRHLTRVTTEVHVSGPPVFQLESHLFDIWLYGLGLAYLCHWYTVRSHVATVHSLVKWTNKLARENQFALVTNEATRIGLSPVWIIMAIGLSATHAWWGVPMVLAGALQKRYITQSSPAIRIALADQARDGFAMPAGDHFCAARNCGARLAAAARFCPRCGTAV